MLGSLIKTLIVSILTDKFVKDLLLHLLQNLAEKSDNKVDDELVKLVAAALESK